MSRWYGPRLVAETPGGRLEQPLVLAVSPAAAIAAWERLADLTPAGTWWSVHPGEDAA